MARNLTPIAKQSRREGVELHPKAAKALARRNFIPGQHGQSRRSKPSDFSVQLREKQKVKRMYGVLEKQFRIYVSRAEAMEGVTGENLLGLLERRLDNACYRLGWAPSRQAARQMVTHAHITLNGKKVDIPSITLKPGDEVAVRASSVKKSIFASLEGAQSPVSWLSSDAKKLSAKVTGLPVRNELDQDIEEQLIIEFYSR